MMNKPRGPICINSGSLKNDLKILNQIKKELEENDIKNYAKRKCEAAPVLDVVEKRYLKNVLRPFKDYCAKIVKRKSAYNENEEFIFIDLQTKGMIKLPYFAKDTMYKNMELEEQYTLKELGITYE